MKPYSIPALAVIGIFLGGVFGVSEAALGGMTAIGIMSLLFDFVRSRFPGAFERQWLEQTSKEQQDREHIRRDAPPSNVEVRL